MTSRTATREPVAVEPEPPTARRNQPPVPACLLAEIPPIDAYMVERLRGFGLPDNLREAVEYALLMGGKRSRPVLVVESCRAVGGSREAALAPAMAIELIHAFSLVHDDLPAMDDDDLRRGQPTAHVKYGEAMAILAGDCMMSLAFQLLTTDVPSPASALLSKELAEGTTAMIVGQVYDTLGGLDPTLAPAGRLEAIHSNKTGALLRAACRMGAIAGGASPEQFAALTSYGESIGLMFQIVDDLLDIEQTAEHTGKRTKKDEQAGKLTYPGVHGAEASRRTIAGLRERALGSIRSLGAPAAPLRELCEWLAVRTN